LKKIGEKKKGDPFGTTAKTEKWVGKTKGIGGPKRKRLI